jgi:hypothetical protein
VKDLSPSLTAGLSALGCCLGFLDFFFDLELFSPAPLFATFVIAPKGDESPGRSSEQTSLSLAGPTSALRH